jgi:ABC-type antimicrobial peptide transport system permease subunit
VLFRSLLFSGQVGLGIAAVTKGTLTAGTSVVLGQFLIFVGALICAVGAVIVSFIVFLMMAQRTKDFGLMKATGCPNSLVFGYFVTELLGLVTVGCVLGIVLGVATDYLIINLPIFRVYNVAPNFWFIPLVFAVYFVFALIFGAKPLFDMARMSPLKALSSVQYFGLGKGPRLKPLSRTGLTLRIASRSLFRRKNATVRLVVFLSVVFLLLTVSVAGGIIANDTSTSWVQQAVGKTVVLIADSSMAAQYQQLLLTYSGGKANSDFNYSDPKLAISNSALQAINQVLGVAIVDPRLVQYGTVREVANFTIDPETLATITIGDKRSCLSLIVGISGGKTVSEPFTRGFFLNSSSGLTAVVGDSISYAIFSPITSENPYGQTTTIQSNALYESAQIGNVEFGISGICIDPLNNGNVTYIPLSQLEQISGISSPNIVLASISQSANYASTIQQIQTAVHAISPNLTVLDLNPLVDQDASFLSSLWRVIMFLPAFALAAAAMCLVSFLIISIDEQHQEFARLRATGAKPSTVLLILAAQSLTVLLSSFAVGASLGTIICVLILTAHPVITGFTFLAIAGWLLAVLLGMFLVSLYPAVRFARKPLPTIMS